MYWEHVGGGCRGINGGWMHEKKPWPGGGKLALQGEFEQSAEAAAWHVYGAAEASRAGATERMKQYTAAAADGGSGRGGAYTNGGTGALGARF